MGDLRAVIRLHRWQIDDKQRALVALREREEHSEQHLARMDAEFAAEQAAVAQFPETAYMLASYARAFAQRREQQEQRIAKIKTQITAALDDLALAFQDLKRFELAHEARQAEQRREQLRKENLSLDEAGMNAFRRRQGEDAE